MEATETRKLLLELADFLKELPPERFDYESWVGRDWQGAPDLSCGTTACAAGWATTLPSFQKLGLQLVRSGEYSTVAYQGYRGAWAMANLLGIAFDEACVLFYPEEYCAATGERSPSSEASPYEVAEWIRHWVEEVFPGG